MSSETLFSTVDFKFIQKNESHFFPFLLTEGNPLRVLSALVSIEYGASNPQ